MSAAFEPTRMQQLILAGQRLLPESPLYNMAFSFEIEGPLDARSPRSGRPERDRRERMSAPLSRLRRSATHRRARTIRAATRRRPDRCGAPRGGGGKAHGSPCRLLRVDSLSLRRSSSRLVRQEASSRHRRRRVRRVLSAGGERLSRRRSSGRPVRRAVTSRDRLTSATSLRRARGLLGRTLRQGRHHGGSSAPWPQRNVSTLDRTHPRAERAARARDRATGPSRHQPQLERVLRPRRGVVCAALPTLRSGRAHARHAGAPAHAGSRDRPCARDRLPRPALLRRDHLRQARGDGSGRRADGVEEERARNQLRADQQQLLLAAELRHDVVR